MALPDNHQASSVHGIPTIRKGSPCSVGTNQLGVPPSMMDPYLDPKSRAWSACDSRSKVDSRCKITIRWSKSKCHTIQCQCALKLDNHNPTTNAGVWLNKQKQLYVLLTKSGRCSLCYSTSPSTDWNMSIRVWYCSIILPKCFLSSPSWLGHSLYQPAA